MWVSHRATAIKCAKEQLRMASPAEREMREMLMRIGGDDPEEGSKHGVPRQPGSQKMETDQGPHSDLPPAPGDDDLPKPCETLSKRVHLEESLMISPVAGTLFYHLDKLQVPAQFTLRMTLLCDNLIHCLQPQNT